MRKSLTVAAYEIGLDDPYDDTNRILMRADGTVGVFIWQSDGCGWVRAESLAEVQRLLNLPVEVSRR